MNGNASWITDIRRSSFLRNRSEWGVMTISDKDSNFHAFSISDSEFSDNETINASIVNLEARNRRFFTTISNTTFNRNISSNPPWGEGGVIEMDPEVVLTLDNVAFGTGADANYHYDISPCNPGLGVVSGTLRGHPQNQLTCP